MLERVSPSAECAAHLVLGRIDAPLRTSRSLGHQFWQHAGDQLNVPPWWPVYLDTIRNKQARPSIIRGHELQKPRRSRSKGRPGHCGSRASIRSLSISRSNLQAANIITQVAVEDKEEDVPSQSHITYLEGRQNEIGSDQIEPRLSNLFIRDVNQGDNEMDLGRAWMKFISGSHKKKHSSTILHLLATSNIQTDLDRATKAYSYIPLSQRTSGDYQNIVDVAIKLNRGDIAVSAIKEAIAKGLCHHLFFRYLAHCVKNSLWNTAANLWAALSNDERHALRAVTHDKGSRSPNFAGKFTSYFEEITGFPSQIVRLANRLQDSDPVFECRKSELLELCKRLVFTAVDSERVMKNITIEEILSLFRVQQQLSFRSKLHFAALGTIQRMKERGSKSQLALAVYRDFRAAHQDENIPKWVFGAMIGISSAGRQVPGIYRQILEDYEALHGTPDNLTYTQVMRALASQGEVEQVNIVFEQFCRRSRPESAEHINPLIRVHAIVGDSKNAQLQFDSIRSVHGLEPDVRSWNALLLAYARSHNSESSFSIFEDLQQSNIQPDEYSWSILASVAAKRADANLTRQIVLRAEKAGISPPKAMIGALIDAHLLNDEIDEAENLVLHATEVPSTDSPIRLWNSLFRYYAFKADSEAILRTQRQMRDYGVKADAMTYAALMTALVVQSRTKEAVQILRTLHASKSISVTEFHYSILIHGFSMEKDRDSMFSMYQEMLERFPRVSPSAKLALLHANAAKDEEDAKTSLERGTHRRIPDFTSTTKLLIDTLTEVTASDLSSSVPNPGFKRRSAARELNSIYLDSLVTFLERNHMSNAPSKMLETFAETRNADREHEPKLKSSWITSLRILSHNMQAAMYNKAWQELERLWNETLKLALSNCSPVTRSTWQRTSSQEPLELDARHTVQGENQNSFVDMIPRQATTAQLPQKELKVLRSFRFILSRQISQYIQALDKQGKHSKVFGMLREVYRHGFRLSSKNWNNLIQVLCRSEDPSHREMAFKLFEKHLSPNAPSWRVIRRGKWVSPAAEVFRARMSEDRDERKRRSALERVHPELLMPTYVTMVHLAAALLKLSTSTREEDFLIRNRLARGAPKTFRLVRKTPYLRDNVQAKILRGRASIEDSLKQYHDFDASSPVTKSNFEQLPGDHVMLDNSKSFTDNNIISKSKRNTKEIAQLDHGYAHFATPLQQTERSDRSSEVLSSDGLERLEDQLDAGERVDQNSLEAPETQQDSRKFQSRDASTHLALPASIQENLAKLAESWSSTSSHVAYRGNGSRSPSTTSLSKSAPRIQPGSGKLRRPTGKPRGEAYGGNISQKGLASPQSRESD